MTERDDTVGRVCAEVRAHLAGVDDDTLAWWRRRLVAFHLRRCEVCRGELERQRTVAAGLEELGAAAVDDAATPPDELLDALLEQAHHPGVRERAAVPARGAVSGARPGLSVALLLAGAAAGTAAGYASWRGARALRRRVQRRPR